MVIAVSTALSVTASAQRGRGAAPVGRPNAPFDPTGIWVSIITEDWRVRMLTPPKGDFESVPLNAEGQKVAADWDPARDEMNGEACKAYGAPAIMRVPTRLRISWQDDTTLKIETDAGQQTRLLRFHPQAPRPYASLPAPTERSWQGTTIAVWERGAIKAVTTGLRAGYLRKNGVPYSEDAVLTEYLDKAPLPNGELLVVSSVVSDPRFLTTDFITSSHFKKEPDATKWSPTPCTTR